ncbi:hypothetical protein CIHG_01941 [Coccidioides immitis H538.4]|uniref:Uncharacterized protein n=3 Tax=Coccidioides TaxID=5500 RepID=A0A0J8QMV4_COCIT|nr:hypothetical protein CPAG_05319 [Coccidioides posadasii RMSCC 3488]KMU73744.1 hypothetical protein CISG_03794 [Coccidioides immitis RMSCC 3703]KMU84155.1 hypothetical protein CIHG_01941 [Coccidioides immitis H538.4]
MALLLSTRGKRLGWEFDHRGLRKTSSVTGNNWIDATSRFRFLRVSFGARSGLAGIHTGLINK